MAGNPALVQTATGLMPAPFQGEWISAERKGVDVSVRGLGPSKWSQRGSVYLSNFRMVFVSDRLDTSTGLHAVDLPLVYLVDASFNQPILGCNNLSGEAALSNNCSRSQSTCGWWCRKAAARRVHPSLDSTVRSPNAGGCWTLEGGPGQGTPLEWTIYFKQGGVGTFLPLFNSLCRGGAPPGPGTEAGQVETGTPVTEEPVKDEAGAEKSQSAEPSAPPAPPQLLQTALVDPSDPTTIYLTQQPVPESQRLKEAPKYITPFL